MSRWNQWLTELMPELFIELSPELAEERGIANLDWVKVSTPRGLIKAKALVTRRVRPFTIAGKRVHQVGMPWHWGWQGVVTGDVVNELTALVGDPNVSIHEGKAFVCNVERLPAGLRLSMEREGYAPSDSPADGRRAPEARSSLPPPGQDGAGGARARTGEA